MYDESQRVPLSELLRNTLEQTEPSSTQQRQATIKELKQTLQEPRPEIVNPYFSMQERQRVSLTLVDIVDKTFSQADLDDAYKQISGAGNPGNVVFFSGREPSGRFNGRDVEYVSKDSFLASASYYLSDELLQVVERIDFSATPLFETVWSKAQPTGPRIKVKIRNAQGGMDSITLFSISLHHETYKQTLIEELLVKKLVNQLNQSGIRDVLLTYQKQKLLIEEKQKRLTNADQSISLLEHEKTWQQHQVIKVPIQTGHREPEEIETPQTIWEGFNGAVKVAFRYYFSGRQLTAPNPILHFTAPGSIPVSFGLNQESLSLIQKETSPTQKDTTVYTLNLGPTFNQNKEFVVRLDVAGHPFYLTLTLATSPATEESLSEISNYVLLPNNERYTAIEAFLPPQEILTTLSDTQLVIFFYTEAQAFLEEKQRLKPNQPTPSLDQVVNTMEQIFLLRKQKDKQFEGRTFTNNSIRLFINETFDSFGLKKEIAEQEAKKAAGKNTLLPTVDAVGNVIETATILPTLSEKEVQAIDKKIKALEKDSHKFEAFSKLLRALVSDPTKYHQLFTIKDPKVFEDSIFALMAEKNTSKDYTYHLVMTDEFSKQNFISFIRKDGLFSKLSGISRARFKRAFAAQFEALQKTREAYIAHTEVIESLVATQGEKKKVSEEQRTISDERMDTAIDNLRDKLSTDEDPDASFFEKIRRMFSKHS